MLFMVIERFRNQDAKAIYARFRERGRMAPEGLVVHGSWIEPNFDRCFQLMECNNLSLLQQWTTRWSDLATFEIVPVSTSKETSAVVYALLDEENAGGNQPV
jgi:hypothetical protein